MNHIKSQDALNVTFKWIELLSVQNIYQNEKIKVHSLEIQTGVKCLL